ncbi:uncharacterized protein N7515_008612 [Penicillium bovifimosum]|uniref:Uncharacterized protein n=1 Tax=Penicillium bovifimosum TaxID=126998 RepID=A0A9W9GPL5_9EURO|nr:uncharacterized protein N7515_008612 [Penicillium bovifimosum]KAJ5124787.1 hypothetical protein N7515_008612 [Penicillium bovifimosum]
MAPPVRPSRSLEGLERVIPPLSPSQHSPLFLNKPLPAKPLSPECSAMWSDSDSQITLDSITASEPRYSTDSYPIFVSSGHDFDDLDPSDQLLVPSPPSKHTDSINIKIKIHEPQITEQPSVSLSSSFDTQYGSSPVTWSQNRTGTNHYFREKKWDYFPELAPSPLQASGRISPNMSLSKPRKKGLALDFTKGKCRGSLGGVRDSIKTYVHRTLSRDSTETKAKDLPRPSTAPMDHHLNDVGSILSRRTDTPPHTGLALDTGITRTVSVATSSSEYDYTNHKFHLQTPISPTSDSPVFTPEEPITPRPKQLAVPLSPYQKYGAAIWEKKEKAGKRVLAPYKSSPNLGESSSSAPELSLTGRSVLLAKKMIVEAKEERRREQLKARIKLVGPVNPHTYVQADPWI